jgi:hypothetical protein
MPNDNEPEAIPPGLNDKSIAPIGHNQPPLETIAYTVNGLCEAVHISRSTFYQEVSAGRLIASKVGRRTIITAGAATVWLNQLELLKPEAEAARKDETHPDPTPVEAI